MIVSEDPDEDRPLLSSGHHSSHSAHLSDYQSTDSLSADPQLASRYPVINEELPDVVVRPSGYTRRQKLVLVFLCISNLTVNACASVLAPFFPNEAEKHKGVSKTETGLIFGSFQLVNFIVSPIIGKYITHLGARFTYLSGIFILSGCSLCFGFLDRVPAGHTYTALCFASRCLEGAGSAATMTAGFAIIAHEFPGQVSTAFGILEVFSGVGFVIGPFFGSVLYGLGGFMLPFVTLGGILLVVVIVYVAIFPQMDGATKPYSGSFLPLLRIPAIGITSLSIFAGTLTLGFFDVAFQPHLDPFNLSPLLIGVVFLTGPLLYALGAPLWGWLASKGTGKVLIVAGDIVCFIGVLLLGPSPLLPFTHTLWLTLVTVVILGLGIGASQVPLFQEMLEATKARGYPDDFETQGLISGLYTSVFSLGAFIGPIGGGALNDVIGFEWTATSLAFIYLAVTIITALFHLICWHLNRPSNAPRQPSE